MGIAVRQMGEVAIGKRSRLFLGLFKNSNEEKQRSAIAFTSTVLCEDESNLDHLMKDLKSP